MNYLRNTDFANPKHVLHLKLQPTHIVHVLGGERFVRPERNVKGVALMPKAKKKKVVKKKAKKAKKKK